MNKRTWITIGIIIAAFASLIGIAVATQPHPQPQSSTEAEINYGDYDRALIKQMAADLDLKDYDPNTVIAATSDSGNLPDHVIGKNDAKITIFEYADYQCSHCAAMNLVVNELLEEYKDKIQIVFRPYVLSLTYNSIGMMAASAAEAASIQGFWKEYKDLLFLNQGDWYYSKRDEFQKQLEDYFLNVAGENGDLEKFRADMASEAVAKRIAFSMALGTKVDLSGTPSFYIDGEHVKNSELIDKIEAKLKS